MKSIKPRKMVEIKIDVVLLVTRRIEADTDSK
jgi:hypothetical protein